MPSSIPSPANDPAIMDAFSNFLNSPGGHAALVLFFFLLIVLFLRRLFGPKGWLRDPHWDEMNRTLRRQEQEAAMRRRVGSLAPLLEREQAVFGHYVDEFCRAGQAEKVGQAELTGQAGATERAEETGQSKLAETAAMYELKREHSLHVLQNAIEIVIAEPALYPAGMPGAVRIGVGAARSSTQNRDFAPKYSSGTGPEQKNPPDAATRQKHILRKGMREPDLVLLLAALYHDLGRFEQLRRYGTFRDADSLNHGRLSAKLLQDPRFLAGEKPEIRALTRLAVLMHNRRELPARLAPALRPLCLALRDADKLDILRIMAGELAPGHSPDPTVVLDLIDEPASYSPALLELACQRQSIAYADMRYVNDIRFLLCGWLNTLAFAASRRILARRGHLETIMAGLPDKADRPEISRLTEMVRQDLAAAK